MDSEYLRYAKKAADAAPCHPERAQMYAQIAIAEALTEMVDTLHKCIDSEWCFHVKTHSGD